MDMLIKIAYFVGCVLLLIGIASLTAYALLSTYGDH